MCEGTEYPRGLKKLSVIHYDILRAGINLEDHKGDLNPYASQYSEEVCSSNMARKMKWGKLAMTNFGLELEKDVSPSH